MSTAIPSPGRSLLLLALLAACGTQSHELNINVSPPSATLFVNGENRGQGSPRRVELDFARAQRVFIQAIDVGHQAFWAAFTEAEIEQMVERGTALNIVLNRN